MIGHLGALAQLAALRNRRLESLTREELGGLARAFGIDVPITEELRVAGMELLKGKSLDSVADLIQSPESVTQIVTFFTGGVRGLADAQAEADEDDYVINIV